MSDPAASGELPWLLPPPYDASAASLTAHAHAIGEAMAGRGRLWLGPFAPPAQLPPGYEGTAVVVPTSGSTGAAKAVALTREALLTSATARTEVAVLVVPATALDQIVRSTPALAKDMGEVIDRRRQEVSTAVSAHVASQQKTVSAA